VTVGDRLHLVDRERAVLIPEWGTVGAAIAAAVSVVVSNALLVWLAWRRLGINCSPLRLRW
jgi:Na+-driven multidrug efflux pump